MFLTTNSEFLERCLKNSVHFSLASHDKNVFYRQTDTNYLGPCNHIHVTVSMVEQDHYHA